MRARLGWLVCLAACNELYGLDETQLKPPMPAEPDTDGDGTSDRRDVCPGVPDDQRDRDHDGFGDACDFCPDLSTVGNHDEDADTHGDECDLCPAEADFQRDGDGDGIGDSCDNDFATQNRLLLFDPFIAIGPVWEQTGTWSSLGDAVSSSSAGGRLFASSVVLDGTKPFVLALGVTTVQPMVVDGDEFGVELVDDGVVVASCTSRCLNGSCLVELTPSAQPGMAYTPVPVSTMALRRTPTLLVCGLGGTFASDDTATMPPAFPRGALRLVGSPRIQFRYVAVWQ